MNNLDFYNELFKYLNEKGSHLSLIVSKNKEHYGTCNLYSYEDLIKLFKEKISICTIAEEHSFVNDFIDWPPERTYLVYHNIGEITSINEFTEVLKKFYESVLSIFYLEKI